MCTMYMYLIFIRCHGICTQIASLSDDYDGQLNNAYQLMEVVNINDDNLRWLSEQSHLSASVISLYSPFTRNTTIS